MKERSNGLGGGFAGYGIYPEYADKYAFHVFYDDEATRKVGDDFISEHFEVVDCSTIPVREHPGIGKAPLIWRYFVDCRTSKLKSNQLDEREYVAQCVTSINHNIDGAYVFSSGKNMGVFKAVGYPEDVGEYYKLEEYKGHCWTAHGRYPTNTPGWWGGAHPFAMLDYTIVHNGEISSYAVNRNFVEMHGYHCDLLTDTEAITYIFDYLNRKLGMKLEDAAKVIASPFWSEIESSAKYTEKERGILRYIRANFPSLLVTGPFSIMLGFEGGFMALNDRLKLRSMVYAEKDDTVYVASEECAIRAICPDIDGVLSPRGGEPIIVRLNK
jgi:glutamate synthase domain-containing protein 1